MTASTGFLDRFVRADEGNNVVEYALVIALMSVVLVILLSNVVGGGLQANIATLIARIAACLAPGATTC